MKIKISESFPTILIYIVYFFQHHFKHALYLFMTLQALVSKIVPLCPSELLPVVVSRKLVRCIMAARVNKKHTLHGLSLDAIKRIAHGAQKDHTACIALGMNVPIENYCLIHFYIRCFSLFAHSICIRSVWGC